MRFTSFVPMPLASLVAAIAIPGNSSLESVSSLQRRDHGLGNDQGHVNDTVLDAALTSPAPSKRWYKEGWTGSSTEKALMNRLASEGETILSWMLRRNTNGAGHPIAAPPAAQPIDPRAMRRAQWKSKFLPTQQGLNNIRALQGLTTVEGLEADLVPVPRQRPGSTRSHGGCGSCKARKKKCDEVHPTCGECTNLKHACIYKGDTPVTLNPADWTYVDTDHLDQTGPATCGTYTGMYSPSQRTIVWSDSYILWPQFQPDPPAMIASNTGVMVRPPTPRDWHDIAAVEYQQAAHATRTLRHDIDVEANRYIEAMSPKWVLLSLAMPHGQSVTAISMCLNMLGISDFPRWPRRITFPIGTRPYNIMLGAEGVKSVAYLLLTHRDDFDGELVISSITVWNDPPDAAAVGGDVPYSPSFLVHISKKTKRLEEAMERNSECEAKQRPAFEPYNPTQRRPFAEKSGPYWPFPLRPYTPAWPLTTVPPRPQPPVQARPQPPPNTWLNAFGQTVSAQQAHAGSGQAGHPRPAGGQPGPAPPANDDRDDDLYN